MSAGFEIINQDGVVLVDENYVNPVLRAYGSAWAGTPPSFEYPPGGVGYADVTYSGGSAPLFAMYKSGVEGRTDNGVGLWGRLYNASTNTWTFRVMVTDAYSGDQSFSYYIFDRPVPVSGGGGAEVYNAAGQMVFSSLHQPLITKKHVSPLPWSKWGHTFEFGVGIDNSNYDVSNGSGGVDWIDIYNVALNGWTCFPNRVQPSYRSYSQNGRQNYSPALIEQNQSTGTFLVDLSRLPS